MVFSPASWEREIAVGSVQGAPVVPTTRRSDRPWKVLPDLGLYGPVYGGCDSPPLSHAHFLPSHQPMRCNAAACDYEPLVHAPPIPSTQYVQATDRSQRGIAANPVQKTWKECA